MNLPDIIFGTLAMLGFIGSFFIQRLNYKVQLMVAAVMALYSLISFFVLKEKPFLFMTILSVSWIVNTIKEMKTKPRFIKRD